MELKHINREISQLATMEATNYISEHGLEKLKEFRYLKGLHEEKVKKLTIPNLNQQSELLNSFIEWATENKVVEQQNTNEEIVDNYLKTIL